MYKFLADFQKRMEWLTPVFFISEKIANAKRFKDEFDLINLSFVALLYFQEITLSEDRGCNVEEVAYFLKDILRDYYKKNVTYQDAVQLSTFIIEDVFRNSGAFYRLNTKDFINNRNIEDVVIKVIETDHIGLEENEYNSYKISALGCELFFRTKEIDKTMRISMEMLRLQEEFEKGNYDTAYKSTQELVLLSRQLRMDIDDVINKIRINIDFILKEDIDEIHSMLDRNFEKEKRDFEKLLNQVYEKIDAINNETQDQYNQEKDNIIYSISKVSENLDRIIIEYTKVLKAKQNIDIVYEEALIDSMDIGGEKRITFSKFLNDIDCNGMSEEGILKFITPVLSYGFDKRLNLDKIFGEQPIIQQKKIHQSDDNNLVIKGNIDNNQQQNIKQLNERYIRYIDILFSYALKNGGSIFLKDLLNRIEEDKPEVYQQFSNDREFYLILIRIYQSEGRNIDISKSYKTFRELKLVPQSDFMIDYIFGKLLDKRPSYRNIKTVYVKRENNINIEVNNRFSITNVRIGVELFA